MRRALFDFLFAFCLLSVQTALLGYSSSTVTARNSLKLFIMRDGDTQLWNTQLPETFRSVFPWVLTAQSNSFSISLVPYWLVFFFFASCASDTFTVITLRCGYVPRVCQKKLLWHVLHVLPSKENSHLSCYKTTTPFLAKKRHVLKRESERD